MLREEGHHHLSSWAVPTSRERLLEENHLRVLVVGDRLWVYPPDVEAARIQDGPRSGAGETNTAQPDADGMPPVRARGARAAPYQR